MRSAGELPEKLLDLIYDAAADDVLWPDVIAGIADFTGSVTGGLFGHVISAKRVYFSHMTRFDEDCVQVYRERYVQNPLSLYMDKQPIGALVASDEIIPLTELKKTAYYHDVFRPQNISHLVMIPLENRRGFTAEFNMCRSERQGPFEAAQMATLRRLLPHMRRSTALGYRLEEYRALQRAEAQALDRLSAGVILLDRAARIILVNRAARRLGADTGPLRLRGGSIIARDPASSRRLDTLVQAVLRGMPAASMGLPHPDDGRLLTLFVCSVRSRDIDRFARLDMRDAAVMIFVFDPAAPGDVPPAWIMDAYGLTMAEARVALCVASAHSVAEIGAQLNISPNTVKTHLRHVFAKTGVNSQAELAGLIASFRLLAGDR
jgi:DNA-binding CsgD family transcriptional regulator/PAS domain-containing protein